MRAGGGGGTLGSSNSVNSLNGKKAVDRGKNNGNRENLYGKYDFDDGKDNSKSNFNSYQTKPPLYNGA